MASPDVDHCELHVTIKDYFLGTAFIDAETGLTSQDIPYEACEITDTFYESKRPAMSQAKITLPSLAERPELRQLLTQIREGDRVEIYNLQPDCGTPVFAGFISPDGLTQGDGRLSIDASDPMVRGTWQHIRKVESFSDPVANLYTRALQQWSDLINEDFTSASGTLDADYNYHNYSAGAAPTYGSGYIQLNGAASDATDNIIYWGKPVNFVSISDGDTILMEAMVTFNQDWHNATSTTTALFLKLLDNSLNGVAAGLAYDQNSLSFRKRYQVSGTIAGPYFTVAPEATNQGPHRVTVLCKFRGNSCIVDLAIDNLINLTATYTGFTALYPFKPNVILSLETQGVGLWTKVTSWRVRKLVSYVTKSGNFVPQTSDTIQYDSNNETPYEFLNLWTQKDGSEYRLNYSQWPTLDTIDLNAAGSLGTVFAQAPLRLEEGWNLTKPVQMDTRSIPHANDIMRMGSGTSDAQPMAEVWSVAEVGNPVVGIAATYPYFESIVNDDRVGIQTLNQSLAGFDLTQATDAVPSLTVYASLALDEAFAFRAGDTIWTKTQTLVNNLEQGMRVMQVRHTAGNDEREIILGHKPWDATMQGMFARDMLQAWLFDQSGSSPLTFVYPSANYSMSAGTFSPQFNFVLDQFTTGSAIISATLHWFVATGSCALVQAYINSTLVPGAAAVDSGVVDVTNMFTSPGQYQLQFKNTDSVTRILQYATLILRMRI